MKKHMLLTLLTVGAAFGLLSVMGSLSVRQARAQGNTSKDFVPPLVFQAAGPTPGSIQSAVDAFALARGRTTAMRWGRSTHQRSPRDQLGRREHQQPDHGGRRKPVRGLSDQPWRALHDTGRDWVRAGSSCRRSGSVPPGGLAGQFNNPTYGTIFQAFSLARLFSAIGGKITDVDFFVPGHSDMPATVSGFGAVFTDVDQPDGSGPGQKHGNRKASTRMEYFDADGELLFSSFVPASPVDGSLSFFGIVFDDARIARVRITSGNAAPGPDDEGKQDIVMMDDFLYGEPQPLP